MSGSRQLVPYATWDPVGFDIPMSEIGFFTATPGVFYDVEDFVAGIVAVKAATSGTPGTALLDIPLGGQHLRLEAGLGVLLKDLTLAYAVTGAPLTAAPSVALSTVTLPTVGGAAAAPVSAAIGAPLSVMPASWPVAVSGAGQVYSVQASLGTQYRANVDLQKVVARLSVPMPATGQFFLVAALWHAAVAIAQ